MIMHDNTITINMEQIFENNHESRSSSLRKRAKIDVVLKLGECLEV